MKLIVASSNSVFALRVSLSSETSSIKKLKPTKTTNRESMIVCRKELYAVVRPVVKPALLVSSAIVHHEIIHCIKRELYFFPCSLSLFSETLSY